MAPINLGRKTKVMLLTACAIGISPVAACSSDDSSDSSSADASSGDASGDAITDVNLSLREGNILPSYDAAIDAADSGPDADDDADAGD